MLAVFDDGLQPCVRDCADVLIYKLYFTNKAVAGILGIKRQTDNIQGAAKKTYHDKNSDFLKTVL